jgi:hypothetical protein
LTEKINPPRENYKSQTEVRIENIQKDGTFYVVVNPYASGFCEDNDKMSNKEMPIVNGTIRCSVCEYSNLISVFCPSLSKLGENNPVVSFNYQKNDIETLDSFAKILSTFKFTK